MTSIQDHKPLPAGLLLAGRDRGVSLLMLLLGGSYFQINYLGTFVPFRSPFSPSVAPSAPFEA